MSDISVLLSGIEGLAPEAISALENYVKGKEQEFQAAAEAKYGIKPSVVSDVETVVKDAAPLIQDAVEKVPDVAALLARIESLQSQITSLSTPTTETVLAGGGPPVPHTLFLEDGSVVKNHGGIATQYSTTDPTTGAETVRKVIAAYPA
jgi:hypothetical protein